MAIGETKNGGTIAKNINAPGSVQSDWVVLNGDAEAAQAAGELTNPHSIDDATFQWWRVPEGTTRVDIAGRMVHGTTVTSSPVVRLVGMSNVTGDNPATGIPTRIDSPTDHLATGVTVDLTVTKCIDIATDGTTADFMLGPLPSATGYDLRGATYVGALIETAANTSGSAGDVVIVGKFLN